MRRLMVLALAMVLLSGGSVASCLAAINEAQARECCARNCPDKPAHNPSQCCSVMTAQEAEVAPAAHSIDAVTHFAASVAPIAAILTPNAIYTIAPAADSPPRSSPPLLTLCSLQL